ncbi:hypothetical protein GCM10027053_18260 [Intrasporangium mesophilum]
MPCHRESGKGQVDRMRYEARVSGRLGMLLTGALGSAGVRHHGRGTTLTITNDGELPLAALVRRLDQLGVQVDYVCARRTSDAPDRPGRARSCNGLAVGLPAPEDDPLHVALFARGRNRAEWRRQ